MAYTQQSWAPGTPITQSKMNHIEEGIAGAYGDIDNKISEVNTTITNQAETLGGRISNLDSRLSGQISLLDDQFSAMQQDTAAGGLAWTELLSVGVGFDSTNNTVTKTLQTALNETYATTLEIRNAYQTPNASDQVLVNGQNQTIATLAQRIKHIYNTINDVNANLGITNVNLTEVSRLVNGLSDSLGTTSSDQSIGARLDHLDGGDIDTIADFPSRNIKSIIEELANAHVSNTYLTNNAATEYNSIDERFEAIEDEIVDARGTRATLETRLNSIDNGQIPAINLIALGTEVSNARGGQTDLDTRLDAIDNITGGNTTIVDRVITLEGSSSTQNTQIGTLNTTVSNIGGRVTTIENDLNTVETGLKARITSLETGLGEANSDIESLQSSLESLTDPNTGEIKDINDKIDMIATELSMLDNEDNIVNTNTRIDQLTETLSGVSGSIATINTTLAGKANSSEVEAALAGKASASSVNTLETTVNGLLDRDTIVKDKPENGSNYTNDIPNIPVDQIKPNCDYLIEDDEGKYFYWRYINNTWELISGAGGGTGTSSAEFYANLISVPEPYSDTVDYYIGSNDNYIHYRYLNNQWVQILPNGLLNHASVDTSAVITGEGADAVTTHKSRPIVKTIGSETNLLANFNAIQSFNAETLANNEGYKLTWVNIDGESNDITITGGGGSANATNASITRITGADTNGNLTSIIGKTCEIEFAYNATDSQGDSVAESGTATWYINRARVATSTVIVGNNIFDITQYLQTGENNITLSVSIIIDETTITRTKSWLIDVKNFTLSWNYDESTIQDSSTINFTCIPYGVDITKTLYLRIDQFETTRTITTSGIPVTITIPNNFNHGVYTAEMWMTATINDQLELTPHIQHDFIVVESENDTPIIAATLPSDNIDQYNTIIIPFVVYTPNSSISTVTLSVNGTVVDIRRDIGRKVQKWYYTPSTLGTNLIYDENENIIGGTHTLIITSGSTSKTLTLTVNKIDINNEEIGGYVFKLKASELSSNTALQSWRYGDSDATKLQFSSNFDWINGGIQTELDENDQIRQYIRIKSGTTMTIPYKIFNVIDPRTNGANFKIIFKIDNCRDYDATALTNVAENIGIQLNAHKAIFKSTTTEISTQYGEEEYTELEFEVYKSLTSSGTDAPDQYMMAWVDGVMATARKYGGNFVQTSANAKDIIIGSTNCDICIYLIKYYPMALTRNDHITNFIADAPNAVEMIRRYNRNDILDTDEDISYTKLAQKNRDCRVWLYDISRMTKAKDDSVDVYNFQQIWENGDDYYQLQGTNAKMKIQGTSSVNYRYGAANTDIDFGKKKAPNATLIDGYGNDLLDSGLEYPGFKINDNSMPITYSNTKVNFASCEQVNNMCNAEWYQCYQPFPSLSARDCMEFAMGVQFIKDRHENEPEDGIPLFLEKEHFNPEKYYMYSIANMGTSKKNTHIFHSENECCIEIKENTSNAQKMKSFDSAWTDNDANVQNYEMRYPDVKNTKVSTEIKDGWARFVQWMVASNPGAATNAALNSAVTFEPYTFRGHNREITEVEGRNFKQVLRGVTVSQYAGTYDHDTFEYRMAKMLSECEDYMAMDSVVYHFCFIERHTMVDNVAKNTFWSSVKEIGGPNEEEGYWIWDLSKNYDNDTSDGNNNNGLLVFDYGNEATDTREGTPVFNGSDAVWFVFISNLYEACRAMFVDREALGAWSSTNYHNYLLREQKKIPERVWNECYWYDYLRTYEAAITNPENDNLDPLWIGFLDGGQKTHQRKHYETYEEIYDSSKYRGSFAHNQAIVLRGEAIDYETLELPAQESKFNITMFNKCYLTIWIGTNYKTIKCEKGTPVILEFFEKADLINYSDWTTGVNYLVKDRVNYDGIQYQCILNHTSQIAQSPDIDTTHWKPVYLTLSNSVIEIDSGSMVQAIGDLSQIYPSSGQFAPAKRLRSLQIGSDIEGYYNPNMNNNTILTFNNRMLEYLYVQNLPQATYNLDLSNCPELKYINAAGSGFTGFVFANGGLLNEAYINNPNSLVMRNLDYLTNANFHLTSPTSVTSLRLEGGKLFDNYTFINLLTNLGVLRLTNINWPLDSVTLLNKLVDLMGMDEFGSTIAQSYLSGTVELLGTVYEGEYNKFSAAWSPDLVIDASHASQFIHEHLVTYQYENGTKIYERYIEHNHNIIDPYYDGLLDSIPVKTADIENYYTFGSTDYADNYIEFSGWRLPSDERPISETGVSQVSGALTIIAVFTPVRQKYTVRWLMRSGQVVKTVENQNYGGGYNLTAPTIKEIQEAGFTTYTFTASGNNCSYSIMTGWEKLPTNISPTIAGGTYDIYPTWLERTNVNYNTVLTDNNYSVEEKLLVLKNIVSARNTLSSGDIFPVTLGYDGIKPSYNILSYDPNNTTGAIKRFTGAANSTVTISDFTPFGANRSFTIAIDYKFEYKSSNVSQAILLSCYEGSENSAQGFKLYYNPNSGSPVPLISFGDISNGGESIAIGSSISNRGIVVLRHIAGESTLYVYSGGSNTGLSETYGGNFRKALHWSNNISNAKIVLGGIAQQNDSINSPGTLFSVKYWEEDLGEGECLQLANWCHETINFAVQDSSSFEVHNAINNTLTSNLVLHTLNASEMGKIKEEGTKYMTTTGWDPSIVKTFYNNRIYQAFPIKLQSILQKVTVPYRKADYNTDQSSIIIRASGVSSSSDYVFASSAREVGENVNPQIHSVEAEMPFSWYANNTMRVLHYTGGSFEENSNYNRASYTNLRFPYHMNPINTDITVYVDYPSSNSSFQSWLSENHSITLQSGDILIPNNSTVAYMYVTAAEINKGAPFTTDTYSFLDTTSGGWIASTSWWTRSVPEAIAQNANYSKFIFVNALGELNSGTGLTQGIVYSIAL